MRFKLCIWTSIRFMGKNWAISSMKLFSLTTGMLSVMLIQLFYVGIGNADESLPRLLESATIEGIALLMSILFATVLVYIILISNQISARSKEFFIRKLYGGRSLEIVAVLFVETIVFLAIAFALSLSLIDLLSPAFNRFTGRTVSISDNQQEIGLLTGAFLTIVPAFLMLLLPAMRRARWRAVDFLNCLPK